MLRSAPGLRYLCLEGSELEGEAAATLLKAPGLQAAHLRGVQPMTHGADSYQGGAVQDIISDTLQSLHMEATKDFVFGAVRLPALRSLTLVATVRFIVQDSALLDASLLRITASSPLLTRLVVLGCSRGESDTGESIELTSALLAPLAAQCPVLEELLLRRTTEPVSRHTIHNEHAFKDSVFYAPLFAFPRLRVLAARVAEGITLHCPALQELHLTNSDLSGGVRACVDSLLASGSSLQVLDVSSCRLTGAHVGRLAAALPTLRLLSARRNCMSREEADAFSRRLPHAGQPGASPLRCLCCGKLTALSVSRRTRHRLLPAEGAAVHGWRRSHPALERTSGRVAESGAGRRNAASL